MEELFTNLELLTTIVTSSHKFSQYYYCENFLQLQLCTQTQDALKPLAMSAP